MSAFDDDESPADDFDAPMFLPPAESLDEDELDIGSDEGYSPADRPRALTAWGITEREAPGHEDLQHRLARQEPETGDAPHWDGIGDATDTDGEPIDHQVGDARAGRLVIADVDPADPRSDYWAYDIGVDGAGALAEEAAVHLVPDEEMAGRLRSYARRRRPAHVALRIHDSATRVVREFEPLQPGPVSIL